VPPVRDRGDADPLKGTPTMKFTGPATLFGRAVVGGYLAVHGAQKLFGSFRGPGLDGAAAGFEHIGLTPGREMAALAGASELGGGLLTATGIAHPLGPISLAGAMTVATAVHRKDGPLASNGGYELALTNLALAAVLAATGPGSARLGPRLPRFATTLTAVGAAALTGASLAKVLTHQPAPPQPDATPADAATETA
jgi:putative oxidoreductase